MERGELLAKIETVAAAGFESTPLLMSPGLMVYSTVPDVTGATSSETLQLPGSEPFESGMVAPDNENSFVPLVVTVPLLQVV